MKPDVTSKHLRTSTELTLIAPIKQGFIEYVDTVTYASRLRMLLNVLFELRKGADERSSGLAKKDGDKPLEYVGPLEQLQTLHFVQWAVFDNDTRLMLNVTFDRSWESYIRDIVDIAGPLLDIILCHCADYEGHSTNLGYEQFASWVRAHQVSNDFFFAAEPALTSDDHRLHVELAELPFEILKDPKQPPLAPELEKRLRTLRVTTPKPTSGTLEDLQRIAGALFDLRRYFAGAVTTEQATFLSADARQELVFYDEIAFLLLEGFQARFDEPIEPFKASASLLASWYRALPGRYLRRHKEPGAKARAIPEDALRDIQRGLLRPFAPTTHGCLVLLQWPSRAEAARFLSNLASKISVETDRGDDTLSLALTFKGLQSLDLTEAELRAFPKEFREGMEARSGILGDVKASHPSTWRMPEANWPPPADGKSGTSDSVAFEGVDAVVLLQANAKATPGDYVWSKRHPLFGKVAALIAGTSVRILHVQPLRRTFEDGAMIEHFGFRDDISQPHVPFEGGNKPAALKRDEIAPGEIVLGYPNARGETVRWAASGVPVADREKDLLLNGSFLVLRKLNQNLPAFESFVARSCRTIGGKPKETRRKLLGQMMGREPGAAATPLATAVADPRDADAVKRRPDVAALQALNGFDFSGGGCPFHAHIRRVNPRDELPGAGGDKAAGSNTPQRTTPRILRRSFPYGPARKTADHGKKNIEHGLMFMAFNAAIADQYEIIQRWVSGGNSTGLASSLADLISGTSTASAFPVEVDGKTHWLPAPDEPLVELQWGMYTFVPSRHAVKLLAKRAAVTDEDSEALAAKQRELGLRGVGLITKLQTLPESIAKVEWKRLLENKDALDDARAIWAAVLKVYGGALRTPLGVLIAGKDNVYEVLTNSRTYSVREYWHRMTDSIGAMHLGMDPEPTAMPATCATAKDKAYEKAVVSGTYSAIAKPLNAALATISVDRGFEAARRATTLALGSLPPNPDTGLLSCDLRDMSAAILQGISATMFGMPTSPVLPGPAVRSSLADFRQCSAYVFTPSPEPWVAQGARDAADAIRAAYRADDYRAIGKALALPADRFVAGANDPKVPNAKQEARAASLKGAAFGFLAATLGSVVSTLYQWVESGELWRLQQSLPSLRTGRPSAADRKLVQDKILAAMQTGPVPTVLHRQVVETTQLGSVALVPGDRVIAALATVPIESNKHDVDVMFGGQYGAKGAPVHACPGRDMAIGVMTGLVWTLLEQHDIRGVSEVNPLKMTLRPSDAVNAAYKDNTSRERARQLKAKRAAEEAAAEAVKAATKKPAAKKNQPPSRR